MPKVIPLVLALILTWHSAPAQNQELSIYLRLLDEGIRLKEDWQLEEGISKIERAADYFSRQGNAHHHAYVRSQLELAQAWINYSRIETGNTQTDYLNRAEELLNHSDQELKRTELYAPDLRADWHFLSGRVLDLKYKKFDEAIKRMHQAMGLLQRQDSSDAERISRVKIQLGETFQFSLNSLDSAEKYLWEGLYLRETEVEQRDYLLAKAYQNLSFVYRKSSRYELCQDFAFHAATIANGKAWPYQFLITNQLGYIHALTEVGEIDLAVEACDYLLSSPGLSERHRLQFELEKARALLDYDADQAKKLFLEISKALSETGMDNWRLSYAYTSLAYISLHKNELLEAMSYLDLAEPFLSFKQSENNLDLIRLHHRLKSEVFIASNVFDSALYYIQKSLIRSLNNFDNQDIYVNPKAAHLKEHTVLLRLIKSKANVLRDRFLYDSHDLNDLVNGLNTSLLADSVLLEKQYSMINEHDWIDFARSGRLELSRTLDLCHKLFETTKDEKYLNIAFHFMDQLKASAMSQYRRLSAKKSNTEIQSLIEQSRQLENKMLSIRRQLFQDRRQNPLLLDYSVNEQLWNELRSTNLKLIALDNTISAKTDQQERAYDNITIYELQNTYLKEGELIVSYFEDETDLYIITISNATASFNKVELDQHTLSLLEEFSQSTLENRPTTPSRFENIAFQLYNKLLAPYTSQLGKQSKEIDRLYILPHGLIQTIPFDALVFQINPNEKSYQKLNYLIKRHNISYGFKADLNFEEGLKVFSRRSPAHLLAMSYSSSLAAEYKSPSRLGYQELPGSYAEIKDLLQIHDGQEVSGPSATKQYFQEHASEYDLIHLAIHGRADTVNVLNTQLMFRGQAEDNKEEGSLYAYELYNMNLRARMVALSACESGTGLYQRGEGSYSMARAFAIAGVPTIVTSLCIVQDRTTAEIMGEFYQKVLEGKPVDNSLREAKLMFINNRLSSNQAHPANWASFVCIGNPQPIYKQQSNWSLLLAAGGGALLLLAFIAYKKRLR